MALRNSSYNKPGCSGSGLPDDYKAKQGNPGYAQLPSSIFFCLLHGETKVMHMLKYCI